MTEGQFDISRITRAGHAGVPELHSWASLMHGEGVPDSGVAKAMAAT